jgi:hypothetical protein
MRNAARTFPVPMLICGSGRRSPENPCSRNPLSPPPEPLASRPDEPVFDRDIPPAAGLARKP